MKSKPSSSEPEKLNRFARIQLSCLVQKFFPSHDIRNKIDSKRWFQRREPKNDGKMCRRRFSNGTTKKSRITFSRKYFFPKIINVFSRKYIFPKSGKKPLHPTHFIWPCHRWCKRGSIWVRLPSERSEWSLEEGGDLTQVEPLFLHLWQGLTLRVILTARCRR